MEIKNSLVSPPGITIKLTDEQIEQIASLREGKEGGFWILGQAWIADNTVDREVGTADFHYFNDEQGQIVNQAILRARKSDRATVSAFHPGSYERDAVYPRNVITGHAGVTTAARGIQEGEPWRD